MGLISELKLAVPWGHIAAKAWGSHQAAPVLCLHGWLNNANSFDRLIPLLPKDFHYVAMDFGGHGLSSHYSQGFPYYHQNFVSEVRRVAAGCFLSGASQDTGTARLRPTLTWLHAFSALKWNRFSLLGHSFGGTVGGMFSCIFPEMVDKLILLDALPVVLDTNSLLRLRGCAAEWMVGLGEVLGPRPPSRTHGGHLGDGQLADLQAEGHRARAAGGGLQEACAGGQPGRDAAVVPEKQQPRGRGVWEASPAERNHTGGHGVPRRRLLLALCPTREDDPCGWLITASYPSFLRDPSLLWGGRNRFPWNWVIKGWF
ncbi:serine hydrolase-like protein 2 isoform 5-T6 [Dama dama]|uniref:serine hydrolase-like protein 2 isoform X5 n=1 Tax=Dama dama TaxID=30532 RepID=UPI002A36B26D|nr:serine hydrolase-like protein 2 isoform X5 [Dama dama]